MVTRGASTGRARWGGHRQRETIGTRSAAEDRLADLRDAGGAVRREARAPVGPHEVLRLHLVAGERHENVGGRLTHAREGKAELGVDAASVGVVEVLLEPEDVDELVAELRIDHVGRHSEDPEILEASWQFGIDVIERIPNLDPEMFKLVIEERTRTRPEAAKAKPEQFFDDSLVRELEKEGFFKKIYAR